MLAYIYKSSKKGNVFIIICILKNLSQERQSINACALNSIFYAKIILIKNKYIGNLGN